MASCNGDTKGLGSTVNKIIFGLFLISIILGLVDPGLVLFWSKQYYAYWKPLYTLNVLFFTNCGFLVVLIVIGCFLLVLKTTNKLVASVYTFGLFVSCVFFVIVLVISKLADPNLSVHNNAIVQNLKDFFADNEDIPAWMHDVQHETKCCGILGPSDWKLLIYPTDKPAIEDVPDSCCVTPAVGCNLITGEIQNNTDLAKWIHVNGCRKHIEEVLDDAMTYLAYGLIPVISINLLLVVLYWYQFNCFLNELNKTKKCEEDGEETEPNSTNSPAAEEQEICEEPPQPFNTARQKNPIANRPGTELVEDKPPWKTDSLFDADADEYIPRKSKAKKAKYKNPGLSKGKRVSFDDED